MARKMKDSGIEWIGEIPEGWSVSKVLHCLSMPITDGPHTTPILYDTGIPFVSAEAVSCGNGRIDFSHIRGYISEQFYKECCQKYVPEIDDIYMIKSGATTGRVAIVDTTRVFTIWSPLAVFRCNKDCMLPKFLYYYLQSPAFQKEVEFGWTFGTQQNVGMRSLEQMKVCVPQLNKQDTIANYLDYQCTQIDLLLQKALTSIEEYKKLKQAVITQAVTKGVRGEREMKPTDFTRWSEIPFDWNLKRVKSCIASISSGLSAVTDDANSEESGKFVLRTSAVSSGFFVPTEVKPVLKSAVNRLICPVEPDTLIVSRMNTASMVGACAYVANNHPNTFLPDKLWKIKFLPSYHTKYMWYALNSVPAKSWFSELATGASSSMQNISINDFTSNYLPIPAFSEQKEIANYLDAKCAEIDKLIAKKEQLVKELESYKKSLIYEVVTGKREV